MEEMQRITFGPFRLDRTDQRLWEAQRAIALSHKAFDVLCCLAERSGRLVTKDEILAQVWPRVVVTDAVLTTAVRELRGALGDDARSPRFIQTVHRRGYRFIAPVGVAPGPASTTECAVPIGRESELERLHAAYATAHAGTRQIVIVAGEAGIGKTSLVEAFVAEVSRAGLVRSAHGQCIEHYGTGEAYLPVLEALGRLAREAGGAEIAALLRRHAPSWLAHLPAVAAAPEFARAGVSSSRATPARMLRELVEALDVIAREEPLILVLEDLHWSDTATLDWLAYVARRRDPARLLVLATYRPVDAIVHGHPLRPVVAELLRQRQCMQLVLDYLNEEQVARYLERRLGDASPAGLAHALHRRSSGNPLYMVTLLDELLRHPPQDGIGAATDVLDALTAVVPAGLRAFIEQQIEQLDAEERALLEAASVAGNIFSTTIIGASIAWPEDRIEATCTRWSQEGRFVVAAGSEAWPDGTLASRFRFRHTLFVEAVYARIGAARLARLHRATGERLELAFGGRASHLAAELALHFDAGGVPTRAAHYFHLAAVNAMARSAYGETTAHLRRALDLLRRVPDAPQRTQLELTLQLALGTAVTATEGWGVEEVERIYACARDLCERLDDRERLALVLWGLLASHVVRSKLPEARRFSRELLDVAEQNGQPLFRLAAVFQLGSVSFGLGELAQAHAHFAAARALEEPGSGAASVEQMGIDLTLLARGTESHLLWLIGRVDAAQALAREAVDLARERSHPFSEAITLAYAALLHQMRRDTASATRDAAAALALCEEHGFAYYAAWSRIILGWVSAVKDGEASAVADIRDAISRAAETGNRRLMPFSHALLAEAHREIGETAAAHAALTEAFDTVSTTGQRWWEPELHRLAGELALAQSPRDATKATACFRRALELARKLGALSLELRAATSLVRVGAHDDRHGEHRRDLERLLEHFGASLEPIDVGEADAVLARHAARR